MPCGDGTYPDGRSSSLVYRRTLNLDWPRCFRERIATRDSMLHSKTFAQGNCQEYEALSVASSGEEADSFRPSQYRSNRTRGHIATKNSFDMASLHAFTERHPNDLEWRIVYQSRIPRITATKSLEWARSIRNSLALPYISAPVCTVYLRISNLQLEALITQNSQSDGLPADLRMLLIRRHLAGFGSPAARAFSSGHDPCQRSGILDRCGYRGRGKIGDTSQDWPAMASLWLKHLAQGPSM